MLVGSCTDHNIPDPNDPNQNGSFDYNVASFDPTTSQIILWTRVSPANSSSQKVTLTYDLATDQAFGQIIKTELVDASVNDDFTISVDISGYEQFHGRYRIVSSETSEALDVNLDGITSRNLITELESLQDEPLMGPSIEIRIHKPSEAVPAPNFSFMQAWPEQFLRMGPGKVWDGIEVIPFNPSYSFAYDLKVLYRKLAFSEDLRTLTVTPSEGEDAFFLQSVPKSVTVQPDGKIVVVTERKIYTSSGVKEVSIKTVYERYTMPT